MIIKSSGLGKANLGRLPRLRLALRDPLRSRAERCLNRRSVKTKGILSEAHLNVMKWEFLLRADSPISLQPYLLERVILAQSQRR